GADAVPLGVAAEGIGCADGGAAGGVVTAGRVVGCAAVASGVETDIESAADVAHVRRLAGADAVPLDVAAEGIELAHLLAARREVAAGRAVGGAAVSGIGAAAVAADIERFADAGAVPRYRAAERVDVADGLAACLVVAAD